MTHFKGMPITRMNSIVFFYYSSPCSFCQKSADRKSPKKYCFFHISFWYLTWDWNPGFTSNKPTHYLLHYADLNANSSAMFVLSMSPWPETYMRITIRYSSYLLQRHVVYKLASNLIRTTIEQLALSAKGSTTRSIRTLIVNVHLVTYLIGY